MNPMVLGFAGYSLLLSSCVALIFLLRMGCLRDILKSPLHVLSTSDTVISMITSLILLVNHSLSPTNSAQASMDQTAEGRLVKDEEYQQNQTCMRFYLNYSDSWPDNQDLGGMRVTCTFQHVLMQYAMFLVPFANAFMSLLIYSVQCSSGISCVAKKCSKLTQGAQNMTQGLDSNFQRRDSNAKENENPNSKDKNTQKTILTISNDQSGHETPNNNPKVTGFGLMTQWLVPVLVTAVLSLSKPQDMEKLHESNEAECVFRVNFPLETCNMVDVGSLINRNEHQYGGLTDKIEIDDPDTSRISYPDSEVIDEIISKVRSVVKLAMNKTCDNSTELKNSSNFRPWNITQYITTIDSTRRNLTSDDDGMLEKLTKIQQVLDSKDPGALDEECTTEAEDSADAGQEVNEDEELKLFEEAVKSAENKATAESPTAMPEKMQPDGFSQEITTADMTEGNEDVGDDKTREIPEENESERILHGNQTTTIKAENITKEKLNEKIYADIIKRIRNTVMQVKAKGQAGNFEDDHGASNSNLREKKLQRSKSSKVSEERKGREKINGEPEGGSMTEAQLNMYDGCFLSAKFLKIHLSILLFIVYFIPVLISGILQTRAVYLCTNVYQQIETADKKNTNISRQRLDLKDSKTDENTALDSKTGWSLSDPGDATNAVAETSGGLENIEQANLGDNTEFNWQDKNTRFKNVLQETKSIQMLFNVLTKSLMLGILMWTPAFLEILSKVFLCASTPPWLVNVLYLLGVSFGIVKNVVNVNIAKINKDMRDESHRKENSVHPSAC